MHGHSDTGTGLLFKFRSGTHGLDEELGDGEDKSECTVCGAAEYESVVYMLWECSSYSACRENLEKCSESC